MKPPMNQFIVLRTPVLDENGNQIKDSYGRPQLNTRTVQARVQFTTNLVRSAEGQEYQSSLEVDVPPDEAVGYGTVVSYTDQFGYTTEGRVLAMNESTNLAGNKVYFRTVNVG